MDILVVIKSSFAFLISFLVTFYLVPVCCAIAQRFNFIDHPDGKIKLHKNSTPYMGGVAVYGGFLVAFCLIFPFENNMLLFFAGATLLLFIGLIDDLIVLRPAQKFFGQILAVLCFLKAGFYLKAQFFSNVWHIPLSAFWMLLVINAFNLVDVMDGLATTLAIGATLSFLVFAIHFSMPSIVLLLSAFLGALLAFLWYNKPTARIYLGDAGSLFIGGLLSTLPFLFNWGAYTNGGYIIPIIILAIPLLEVTTLIVIRFYKKIPFYLGSPDHFSMYLQGNGWSKRTILFYIVFLNGLLLGVSWLFLNNCISETQVFIMAGLFLLMWFGNLIPKTAIKRVFSIG